MRPWNYLKIHPNFYSIIRKIFGDLPPDEETVITRADLLRMLNEEMSKPPEEADQDLMTFCAEELSFLDKKKLVEKLVTDDSPCRSVVFACMVYTGKERGKAMVMHKNIPELRHGHRDILRRCREAREKGEKPPYTWVVFK
ncbi:MAG: hypothetical protein IJ766_08630 [Clostridia bacterium]|nr:hypothetical protein [Clostridia bacterium]